MKRIYIKKQRGPGRDFTSLKPSLRRIALSLGVDHLGSDALDALLDELSACLGQMCTEIISLLAKTDVQTIKFEHVIMVGPELILSGNKPCATPLKKLKIGDKYDPNCHFLTKAVVERKIRSKIGNYRLSADALDAMIDAVQIRIVKVIESAGMITKNARRNTMNGGDVSIALLAMSNC